MRALKQDQPALGGRCLVCLERFPRTTEDGLRIVPVASFLEQLWVGQVIA